VFTGTTYELLDQHARATPPALRDLANDVPAGFEAVVMRCLEKETERLSCRLACCLDGRPRDG
jgi:hypothetical protein